ncbi:MAG: acyltransferase [Piscirickettsiaceae bacterium]|nr:MAG: acyltransferase [Piscirickettsiaceae bacterium]PCI68851.1 MAG: acyltransferase [Piscirickettsiaceae bacterium]
MKVMFKFLKLNVNTHGDDTSWANGDIFLFNHFARFEAVIPQYLIYKKTKAFTHAIATKELFSSDELISKYLINLGGIPTDADNLMFHVSKGIFKGIKLIAFPEGGIVKDRRVLDDKGRYRVYSRSHDKRRKLHTGPAVIGLTIAIFKASVRKLQEQGNIKKISLWATEIGLDDGQQLIDASRQPTTIIPCNITFYPLRVKENRLTKGLKLLQKKLDKRLSEELLIEGNFLLKDTDMDIQILKPIVIEDYWSRWEETVTTLLVDQSQYSLSELFNREHKKSTWGNHIYSMAHRHNVEKIRDTYMQSIYSGVTINIAHLASSLFMHFIKQKKLHVNKKKLHELLYVSAKLLQQHQQLNTHKTLQDPSTYRDLLFKNTDGFDQFLRSVYAAELIEKNGAYYRFTGLLSKTADFDAIRHQNPIAVYANEVAPIPQIAEVIKNALSFKINKRQHDLADMLFEDELLEYQLDDAYYQQEKYHLINQTQSLTQPTAPYILKPKKHNGECVILIHGLLSSPGELSSLAKKILQRGYIVLGTRLKGHGTSPWDLQRCRWQDWQQSVRQSIKIARCYTKKVHLMGFSSGSLLALHFAANRHFNFASITACSTPIYFNDPLIGLIKIADKTNKLVKALTGTEGVLPFKKNEPEHPHINYRHIPISSVHELLKLVDITKRRLKKITCPVYLLQADNDPVVDRTSMGFLLDSINQQVRQYDWVTSNRHGIVFENTDNCHQKIVAFIDSQHQIA